MDYEEKYKRALERAKYALNTDMDDSGHWAVNYIFPELKESEDERIRKEIVDFITSSNKYGTNERCEAWLNWLEKQGKQKTLEMRGNQVTNEIIKNQKEMPGEFTELVHAKLWDLIKAGHKMLDADKVIAWLEDQACLGWIEDVEVHIFVDKFKKDFGL